ncbi:hypothetical protein [Thalassotalea sp. G2M2-11]|nr:hypothetical protein [Thalassotalea sp. G2M2-11]
MKVSNKLLSNSFLFLHQLKHLSVAQWNMHHSQFIQTGQQRQQ